MPRRPESRALLAVQFTLWLERVSRRFVMPQPKPPIARFHQVNLVRTLPLEQPIYAARKPPKEYVFIPEDEYFRDVERLLEESRKP
jgi:hypothetical protein